jgi:hypothetical protein
MLWERCHQRQATVHLTEIARSHLVSDEQVTDRHFCEQCGDYYMKSHPTLDAMRSLVCLSEGYRDRLYDLLTTSHPEAFYDGDDDALGMRAAEAMTLFLRDQLNKEGIEVNDQVFEMLLCDFIGSHHFYTRRDAFNQKKS